MAITFVKRSSIPVSVKGKAATEPTIAITEKGQIALNSIATKYLGDQNLVGIGFDKDNKRLVLYIKGSKSIAKVDDKELFKLSRGKEGKGRNAFMTATNLLRDVATFGDHLYDFAGSGGQTFPVSYDEKSLTLTIDMPKGTLPRRPKVARKKRGSAKSETVGVAATPSATAGVPVSKTNGAPVANAGAPAADDELVL